MAGLLTDLIALGLPKAGNGGALPLWIGFVSVLAIFNTIQNFISPTLTRRVYSNKPHEVSPLSGRTFGIWTLLAAILRLYTAYDIHNKGLYDVCLASYVLVAIHFYSELLVYRSAKFGLGVLSPIIVGSISLYWMVMERSHYLAL